MIAEINQDQLISFLQPTPEGQVAVDRKPVAVTQRQPRAGGIAMLPKADDGAIVHSQFNDAKRCRQLDTQLMLLQYQPQWVRQVGENGVSPACTPSLSSSPKRGGLKEGGQLLCTVLKWRSRIDRG